jgi:hypothetical protein
MFTASLTLTFTVLYSSANRAMSLQTNKACQQLQHCKCRRRSSNMLHCGKIQPALDKLVFLWTNSEYIVSQLYERKITSKVILALGEKGHLLKMRIGLCLS